MTELYVGIDLGTTNSVISVARKGEEPKVVPTPDGSKTTPSIVKFIEGGALVGNEIKKEYTLGSTETKGSFKVDMGSKEVYRVGDKDADPVELSTQVLAYLKKYAEDYVGEEIKEAVITVPAYFTEIQRKATQEAAEKAGIKVARMINEPTACALAYGVNVEEEKNILVYDLGGGTFDVSILSFTSGLVEVVTTLGDSNLGGDDFDYAIYKKIEKTLAKNADYIPSSKQAENALKLLARKAKEALSEEEVAVIDLTVIKDIDPSFKADFDVINLTRDNVFKIVKPLLDRTVAITLEAIKDAGSGIEIDEILLTGGSTRLFCLPDYLSQQIGMKTVQGAVDPDLSISIGACIQHSIIGGDNSTILFDVTPMDLSVEVAQGLCSVLIKRQSNIPTKATKTFTTDEDDVTMLKFHIVQGNDPLAKNNASLGQVLVPISTPLPAGVPVIDVTFALDTSGSLKVTAINQTTGEKEVVTRKL